MVWYGVDTEYTGWGTTQARYLGCCQQNGHEKKTMQKLTKQAQTGPEKHKLDQNTPQNTHKLRASRVVCPAGL